MSETTKTATAAYCGRRFTTKNKLAHSWLIDGAELLYAKQLVSWAQIGESASSTRGPQSLSVRWHRFARCCARRCRTAIALR
jgi:hypothetical protein